MKGLLAAFLITVNVFGTLPPSHAQESNSTETGKITFDLPKANTYRLDNGLTVSLINYGSIPKTSISIRNRTGAANEPQKGITELAYLAMTNANSHMGYERITKLTARMGATLETYVEEEHSGIDLDVLSNNAVDALELLASLLVNFEIDAAKLPDLQRDIFEKKQRLKNDTFEQLDQLLLMALKGESVNSFFEKSEPTKNKPEISYLSQAIKSRVLSKNTHIFISGMFNVSDMKNAIEKIFTESPLADVSFKPKQIQNKNNKGKIVLVDQPGATQTFMQLGFPVAGPKHQDYNAVVLMNTMLGGAVSSRITQNIREDKGYAYYPYSKILTNASRSYWILYSELSIENTIAAIDEVQFEINRLQKQMPTREELTGFKKYAIGQFIFGSFSRSGIIRQHWFHHVNDVPISRLNTYSADLNSLNPEDISRVSSKYLVSDSMIAVFIGDSASLKKQIEKSQSLNQFELIEL